MCCALILSWGVGLAIVAMNPSKNHGLVLAGAIGKVHIAIVWTWGWYTGLATAFLLVASLVDFAFAIAFVWFLTQVRKT